MFGSLKRYCQVLFYVLFVLSVDSMNFFMKYVLWIPADSDILKARVAIWAFSAVITSKEYFEYIDDPNCKRVGPFIWLSTFTIAVEYGVWFKFSKGIVDAPFPWYVKLIFVLYGSFIILGAIYAAKNGYNKKEGDNKKVFNHVDPELTIENTQKVLLSNKKDKSN